jgi:hypothetical protein
VPSRMAIGGYDTRPGAARDGTGALFGTCPAARAGCASASRRPPGAQRPASWRQVIRDGWQAEDGQLGPQHAVTSAEDHLTKQQAAVVTARDRRRGSPQLIIAQIACSELLVAGGFATAGRHGTAGFWRCISWAVFVHQHRGCLPWCRGGRIASPSACAIGRTAVS